jgi:hypothetical protein
MGGRAPIILLKIDVTATCKELLRNGHMSFCGRDVQRRRARPPFSRSISCLHARAPSCHVAPSSIVVAW